MADANAGRSYLSAESFEPMIARVCGLGFGQSRGCHRPHRRTPSSNSQSLSKRRSSVPRCGAGNQPTSGLLNLSPAEHPTCRH